MTGMSKFLDTLSSVAILIVAVLVGGLVVREYLAPAPKSRPPQIGAGQTIPLKEINWAESPKHLVLALSSRCRYCTESAPFYQRLVRQAEKQLDVDLIAFFPQTVAEGADYLEKLSVPVAKIRQVPFKSVPISATPTILLVNSSGTVEKTWVGKLPAKAELEIMGEIGCRESCDQ